MSLLSFAQSVRHNRLESQLANVLRRVGLAQVGPVVGDFTVAPDGVERLVEQYRAEEALRKLERQGAALEANPTVLREVRRIVERLYQFGLIDVRGELAKALAGTGVSAADVLSEPTRIAQRDALLYDKAARGLVHEHLAGNFQAISDTMTRGLERGLTDKQLGSDLHALGATTLRSHADTWARTETTRFYTLGRTAMIEDAGPYVWGYEYVVIDDDRTTDICRELVGKRVAKADMTAWPPFHWNCRTTVVAVMAPGFGGPRNPRTTVDTYPDFPAGFGVDVREPLRRAA